MSKKKKTSARVITRQQKAPAEQSWLRRQLSYAPAWIVFFIIVVLFVLNSLGQSIAVPGIISNDILHLNDGSKSAAAPTFNNTNVHNTNAALAPFFQPSVLYWQEKIYEWAAQNELNPNIVAILMQIESCGHPYAGSGFANGLFQVTPDNFASLVNRGVMQQGTNQIDPDLNAEAGLYIFDECLLLAQDNLEGAFACYNGGPSAITPQNRFQETRDYLIWSSGLWAEVQAGQSNSPTLTRWLNSGGSGLCQSAAEALSLLDPLNLQN